MRRWLLCMAASSLLVVGSASARVVGAEGPKRLDVFVDGRIELIAVLQLLSEYYENVPDAFTRLDLHYLNDIRDHFGRFKGHEAVKLFDELWPQGLNYDAPPTLMLFHSEVPELRQVFPYSEYIIGRLGDRHTIDRFMEAVRSFARDTRFVEFFSAHRDLYSSLENQAWDRIGSIDPGEALESYLGEGKESYNVILAPTFHAGGYGPKITDQDGKEHLYSIIGPSRVTDGVADFGPAIRYRDLCWHEFGHSFVNQLTAENIDRVEKTSILFGPIRDMMSNRSYRSWETCLNEMILRAIHARMLELYIPGSDPESWLFEQRAEHFAYVEVLAERLMEYDADRKHYPTLRSFFPRILDLLDELASRDIDPDFYIAPFAGPLAAVWRDNDLVVIVPTAEVDDDVEARIRESVTKMLEMTGLQARVIDDRAALLEDLSDNSIAVYGTPDGNLWLKKHLPALSGIVKKDGVKVETMIQGADLRFCTTWPSPFNGAKGVSVYTAQTAGAVVGINELITGGTDFVVGDGTKVLISGDYRKSASGWRF